MATARWMAFIFVGMLLSGAAAADGLDMASDHDVPSLGAQASVDDLIAASSYADRWQPVAAVEPIDIAASWPSGAPEIYFRDTAPAARFARLRNLSLVTLLDDGESRLFLGVNDRGVIGLHFGAFSHVSTGEILEILRMPYLERERSAAD